ncbi:MAG: glycine--tRNA ligase subunit beta [Candidatus Tectomicrobia bacterium]|nr:glycine--tRNA ligase subunit beta [Candidatus Tectomicrobia bacterium]
MGIIEILIDNNILLSLREAVQAVAPLLPVVVEAETLSEVVMFIQRRLYGWLRDQGFRHDLVEAVLAEQGDNPTQAAKALTALNAWTPCPEFEPLLQAYNRVVRMIRGVQHRFQLTPEYLEEPAAQRLHAAYLTASAQATSKAIDDLITAMIQLVEPINAFLTDLLVMHEDEGVRKARVGLLQRIAELPRGIVDLSKIDR